MEMGRNGLTEMDFDVLYVFLILLHLMKSSPWILSLRTQCGVFLFETVPATKQLFLFHHTTVQ